MCTAALKSITTKATTIVAILFSDPNAAKPEACIMTWKLGNLTPNFLHVCLPDLPAEIDMIDLFPYIPINPERETFAEYQVCRQPDHGGAESEWLA